MVYFSGNINTIFLSHCLRFPTSISARQSSEKIDCQVASSTHFNQAKREQDLQEHCLINEHQYSKLQMKMLSMTYQLLKVKGKSRDFQRRVMCKNYGTMLSHQVA